MSIFLGVARYEYHMAIRRWGVWLAVALAGLMFVQSYASNLASDLSQRLGGEVTMWQLAALAALLSNLLMPVVAGIAMADRLPRDAQLGVRELLLSTSLSRTTYVVGKYFGVVLAVLTPVLAVYMVCIGVVVAGGVSLGLVGPSLVAFLAINVPTYMFIGAFSVACPAVLPVRVYQVLFTGYWFWGNFLNSDFIPTLSGTIVTPSGIFAAGGFFNANNVFGAGQYTSLEAVINLAVLFGIVVLVLLTLDRFLAWQESRV